MSGDVPQVPIEAGPALPDQAQPRGQWVRKGLALLLAITVDAPPLCLLGESYPVLFDVGVALALWLILGRSRLLVVALLIECIPGAGLAPTWTAYVLFAIIAGKGGRLPGSGQTDMARRQD